MERPVVVLPFVAALIALACAVVVGIDGLRRPKPNKAAWFVAFLLFAIAAGAEVIGAQFGWSAPLARVYYLAGAVLVVGFLALGELYLLAPGRIARVAPGTALLVSALAATVVMYAPVDPARLATDGWRAIERGPVLVALAVAINTLGTLVLVAGALWSAWRFTRLGIFRHRAIGCVLIAVGTLAVASGGSATRLGRPEYLYVAMSVGIALIFAGYLETRRRDALAAMRDAPAPALAAGSGDRDRVDAPVVALRAAVVPDRHDEGIDLVEGWLRQLDPAAISERCRLWSAPADDGDAHSRPQAREVWALRLRLGPEAKSQLDALPPAIQRQLAEVYAGVFAAPSPGERPLPPGPDRLRQAAG